MTQSAKVQEPSMEEILASIRRIIADDEAKPAAAEKAAPPARPAACSGQARRSCAGTGCSPKAAAPALWHRHRLRLPQRRRRQRQ